MATSQHFLTLTTSVVIAVSCLGAFVGLHGSSFWTDEFFTAYFADPTTPTFGTALSRAAEDTNPPVYYLLLRQILRLSEIDIVIGSRAFSAATGCLAVLAILLAPTKGVGLSARLVAGVCAATSAIWFQYSQEARSYALLSFFVVCLLATALRCADALRDGRIPAFGLAILVVFSLVASLTHYYAFLLAAAVFTSLLLFVKSLRALTSLVLSGLILLISVLSFVSWHQPQIVLDIQDTWFSASMGFLAYTTIVGLAKIVSSPGIFDIALLFLLLVTLLTWGLATHGLRTSWQILHDDLASRALIVILASCALAYLYAVILTFAFTPILGPRFFNVLAPAVWLTAGYLTHIALKLLTDSRQQMVAAVTTSVAVLLLGTSVAYRGMDTRQPWRHSAEAVAALPGCTSATLPVVWFEQRFFEEDNPERFYGFYLPSDPDRTWLPVNRYAIDRDLNSTAMVQLVRDTLHGTRECPLLLWSVHMSIEPEEIAKQITEMLGSSAEEYKVTSRVVRPSDSTARGFLFILEEDLTTSSRSISVDG